MEDVTDQISNLQVQGNVTPQERLLQASDLAPLVPIDLPPPVQPKYFQIPTINTTPKSMIFQAKSRSLAKVKAKFQEIAPYYQRCFPEIWEITEASELWHENPDEVELPLVRAEMERLAA
eukprot:140455_1